MARNDYINVAAGSGSAQEFAPKCNNSIGVVQVSLNSGASGTVTVKSRISPSHDWVTQGSLSADGMLQVTVVPYMCFDYNITGGTFSVSYWESV